ncbi:MAG: restriction endonuclease [bacterium]|nr:restriction endonuclease [bacterium]
MTYPFEIRFADQFQVRLDLRIAVDCKRHSKPVGIKKVEEFLGQMADVSAHAGIMVSAMGFGAGAKQRAEREPIFLIDAPRDILLLAEGFKTPGFFLCKCCAPATEGRDGLPGVVLWSHDSVSSYEPSRGSCTYRDAPHVMCPDCLEVMGFFEGEFGRWLNCLGYCGRIYSVEYRRDGGSEDVDTIGGIECKIMSNTNDEGWEIALAGIDDLIAGTKWQYAEAKAHPVRRLKSRGFAEVDEAAAFLRLTEVGTEFAESLHSVEDSVYGW